jgi:hypothetical protein
MLHMGRGGMAPLISTPELHRSGDSAVQPSLLTPDKRGPLAHQMEALVSPTAGVKTSRLRKTARPCWISHHDSEVGQTVSCHSLY